MSYVDIGWPIGLCCLAVTSMVEGSGLDARKYLATICLLLHGGRMALGALALFFPYKWKEDLPRYVYARTRFVESTGDSGLWPLKQQHDTLMQAFANSVTLAGPIILMATNPNPELHVLEIVGGGCWAVSWVLENVSDISKDLFVKRAKKNGDIRTAVIGWKPYDTNEYWLWTKCRHPNYFFEWMCWNSFILMSIPSIIDLFNDKSQSNISKAGIIMICYLCSRTFYDCLLYWTGSEPAESRSVERRPDYKAYQKVTRVFFPFPICFFDHHMTPGWPNVKGEGLKEKMVPQKDKTVM